jgi:hypothetical protein
MAAAAILAGDFGSVPSRPDPTAACFGLMDVPDLGMRPDHNKMRAQRIRDTADALSYALIDDGGQPIPVLGQFLGYLGARGCSPNTLSAYAYDLLHFTRFLHEQGWNYDDFTPARSLRFLEYLHNVQNRGPTRSSGPVLAVPAGQSVRRLAPATINRALAAVSSFYEYLILSEHCREEIARICLNLDGHHLKLTRVGSGVQVVVHFRNGWQVLAENAIIPKDAVSGPVSASLSRDPLGALAQLFAVMLPLGDAIQGPESFSTHSTETTRPLCMNRTRQRTR